MEGKIPLVVELLTKLVLQEGELFMDLEFKLVRNTLVVKVKGELDLLVTEKLSHSIEQKMEERKVHNLILNLEKVTFIDSSGLGMIVEQYSKISSNHGKMYIVGAIPSVQKVLTFSGIKNLIPLYKSEQDIMNI